ncbi:MAG: transposase [Planctomycetaceae bacterium]|nr:transposase [Planctomycetaceae bacterium]
MIHAYHVIFGTYGFWLPNDPRGSWSDFVGSWELFRFGKATKVLTCRSLAAEPHDRRLRFAAKSGLKHDAVSLTGRQAVAVEAGFRVACEESSYRVLALSILPEHVHAVVVRGRATAETIIRHLKSRATQSLIERAEWSRERPVWGKNGWKVFLNSPAAVHRAVEYVEENPVKEGKRRQNWPVVSTLEL